MTIIEQNSLLAQNKLMEEIISTQFDILNSIDLSLSKVLENLRVFDSNKIESEKTGSVKILTLYYNRSIEQISNILDRKIFASQKDYDPINVKELQIKIDLLKILQGK